MSKEEEKDMPQSAQGWLKLHHLTNEELEIQREQFVRNVAQRETGISADREKFPDGVKTGSYKRLPPNKEN